VSFRKRIVQTFPRLESDTPPWISIEEVEKIRERYKKEEGETLRDYAARIRRKQPELSVNVLSVVTGLQLRELRAYFQELAEPEEGEIRKPASRRTGVPAVPLSAVPKRAGSTAIKPSGRIESDASPLALVVASRSALLPEAAGPSGTGRVEATRHAPALATAYTQWLPWSDHDPSGAAAASARITAAPEVTPERVVPLPDVVPGSSGAQRTAAAWQQSPLMPASESGPGRNIKRPSAAVEGIQGGGKHARTSRSAADEVVVNPASTAGLRGDRQDD
jgi:hypothetical protein